MSHRPVLFLSGRRSVHDIYLFSPFVGTPVYKEFLNWLYRMDVDINQVQVINSQDHMGNEMTRDLMNAFQNTALVVTLGPTAKEVYERFSYPELYPKPSFNLPHPSDRNLDRASLSRLLVRCKTFLNKGM